MSDSAAIDDFKYINYGTSDGPFYKRATLLEVSDIDKYVKDTIINKGLESKIETYVTAYQYNEEMLNYFNKNKNSVTGFNGINYSPYIYIDVDYEDVSIALEKTKDIVKKLVQKEIAPTWLRYFFSGAKGFHIQLSSKWVNANPIVGFSQICRSFIKELVEEITVDPRIYNSTRLFRREGSVNLKSYCDIIPEKSCNPRPGEIPLYKIPLYYDEISELNIIDIKKLAEIPRRDFKQEPQNLNVISKLETIWNRIIEKKDAPRKATNIPLEFNIDKVPVGEKPCIYKLLNEGLEIGERVDGLMVLIDYYRRVKNMPQNIVESIALEFADTMVEDTNSSNPKPSRQQVISMVETQYDPNNIVFSEGDGYGCNSPVMDKRCCRSNACSIWKYRQMKEGIIKDLDNEDFSSLSNKIYKMGQLGDSYKKRLIESEDNGEKFYFGLPKIDKIIRGVYTKEVVMVLGRSGAGKTTLMTCFAENMALMHNNPPTILFSMEDAATKTFARVAAKHNEVEGILNLEKIVKRNNEKTNNIIEDLQNKYPNLMVVEESGLTVNKMIAYMKAAKEAYGYESIPIVIIDYIQIMGASAKDEYSQLKECSLGIRRLAKEMNSLVIFGCQTNRADGGFGQKALNLGSGLGYSIENGADIIFGAYRPNKEQEEANNEEIFQVNLQVIKSKSSKAGFSEPLLFDGDKAEFTEYLTKQEKKEILEQEAIKEIEDKRKDNNGLKKIQTRDDDLLDSEEELVVKKYYRRNNNNTLSV